MIQVMYKSSDAQVAFGVMDKLQGLYMEKHLDGPPAHRFV